MFKKDPLVSVIMAVYNCESYVSEAVNSILEQSYSNFEIIIINDNSQDRTLSILEGYKDPRLKIFSNEINLGLTKCLNIGIDKSNGVYIARMDGDDICEKNRISEQVNFMGRNPDIGVCGTWMRTFGSENFIFKYPTHDLDIKLGLTYQSQFCHPSVMIRKEILDKIGIYYDEDFLSAQDYALWTDLSPHTQFANLPDYLINYRIHSSSISSSKREQQKINQFKIIQRYFSKTNLNLDQGEIQSYLLLTSQKFNLTKDEFLSIKITLEKLICIDSEKLGLTEVCWGKFLAEKWFHLCYNIKLSNTNLYREYFNSPLAEYRNPNVFEKLKFKLKQLS